MKKVHVVMGLLWVASLAAAQDTLKVMTWNLLDYNATTAQSRNQYDRTVIRHVKPDVLVVQEMTTQAAVDSFFNNVVNMVFPGQFTKGIFLPDSHPDTGNEIYYRTAKFTFVSNTRIHTLLRDISEFKLYNATASDTIRIYSVHLKASTGFEADRGAEVDSLRRVTNALPTGKYFMVVGDYNIYAATEVAYEKLLQDNPTDDGNFIDALTMPGTWNNNGTYAPYHTQSTRVRALPDGGATGGLDDRFDMILYSRAVSQPGKIQYLAGSLTPIGNDGNHFNDSINQMPNAVVPDSVANALYFASDHLPVSARFVFSPGGGTNFAITAIAAPHGAINPNGVVTVASGANQTFDMLPSTGYHVDSVIVDGSMTGSPTSFTFTNVQSDHTIRTTFDIDRYVITATADSHGTISPSGSISVPYGGSQRFVIVPGSGYHVDSILVDGIRTDSTASYTFGNVTSGHQIHAAFGINQYAIAATAGLHGTISPAGTVPVTYGSSLTFTVSPDSGYQPDSLLVDGLPVTVTTSYAFTNITANHSIHATFGVSSQVLRVYGVQGGWNLVSLPLTVSDRRKVAVFPAATSQAFCFVPASGYAVRDTLSNGPGYWLQFASQQNVSISGFVRLVDTLQVVAGWNMIGSISSPVPVGNIQQIPSSIVTTPYYKYSGSYSVADTLMPASGYWVKVSQDGRLVLR